MFVPVSHKEGIWELYRAVTPTELADFVRYVGHAQSHPPLPLYEHLMQPRPVGPLWGHQGCQATEQQALRQPADQDWRGSRQSRMGGDHEADRWPSNPAWQPGRRRQQGPLAAVAKGRANGTEPGHGPGQRHQQNGAAGASIEAWGPVHAQPWNGVPRDQWGTAIRNPRDAASQAWESQQPVAQLHKRHSQDEVEPASGDSRASDQTQRGGARHQGGQSAAPPVVSRSARQAPWLQGSRQQAVCSAGPPAANGATEPPPEMQPGRPVNVAYDNVPLATSKLKREKKPVKNNGPGSVAEYHLDAADVEDALPILLFDLNGTLTNHTASRRGSGSTVVRPGVQHLRRLKVCLFSAWGLHYDGWVLWGRTLQRCLQRPLPRWTARDVNPCDVHTALPLLLVCTAPFMRQVDVENVVAQQKPLLTTSAPPLGILAEPFGLTCVRLPLDEPTSAAVVFLSQAPCSQMVLLRV